MANQALINYIVQQLNNSYKPNQISQHLVNNGYRLQDVQEALTAANTIIAQQRTSSTNQAAQIQPQTQNITAQPQQQNTQQAQTQQIQPSQPQILQANPQLVSYITQQRNAGFSQEQIKSYLLRYGYQQQQVEPALDSVFHPIAQSTSRHISHLGALIVSAIVLVSVFSGAGIFFFFNNASEAPELLDYRLDVAKKIFNPGETLIFEARMDKAAGEQFDVKLRHTVYDQQDNEIESVDETAEAQPRIASKMELPDNLKPGRYKLVSVGKYGEDESQEVYASFNFEVKGADSNKGEGIEKQPNLDQPKKIDTPKKTDTTPQPLPQQPKTNLPDKTQPASPSSQPSAQPSADEDEQKVSIDNIEADVRIFAADINKVTQAESLCKTLTTSRERDFCYADIVEVSKQKQYCDKIDDAYSRDVCYLNNFMIQGDYSVCSIINDFELNQACKDLAKRNPPIAQSTQDAITNNTDAAISQVSQDTSQQTS